MEEGEWKLFTYLKNVLQDPQPVWQKFYKVPWTSQMKGTINTLKKKKSGIMSIHFTKKKTKAQDVKWACPKFC